MAKRLSTDLYPDSAATTALQRKAALKASELLASMGDPSGEPRSPLSVADARTIESFTGFKSPGLVGAHRPVGLLNQANWLADETRKMNRGRARKSTKGGF